MKTGALLSYLSIALNILAGLLYTPWMIRQIGQSDYGIYTLANSVVTLFMIDFGLSAAASRFVAKYRAEGDMPRLESFISVLYKLYFLVDAILFLVLLVIFFCLEGIYQQLLPGEVERLRVVYCIVGLFSLINFPCVTFNGILTAYEKFIPLKLSDVLYRALVVLFTVIALSLGMGLYAMVSINALCGLFIIGYKYFYVRKCVSIRFRKSDRQLVPYREVFSFSVWSTVNALAQRLVFNVSPTILGHNAAAASAQIAVFGIIATIESYIYTITTAINGLFLSRTTKIMINDADGSKLTSLTVAVGRFQYALNGLIILVFALIGQEFILLWMGPDYLPAYTGILLVTVPAVFFNALQIATTALIVRNEVKFQAFIAIAVGICNLICSFFFSKRWGAVGAAGSICIAYSLRVVLTMIVIKKKINLNLATFIKMCFLRMSIPMILPAGIGALFLYKFNANTWLRLGVKGIVLVAIYLLSVWLFGLSKEERTGFCKRIRGN